MILVVLEAPIFDCYVQRVLIQMGLLKSIKYSMFAVSALNEIVDEWIRRMNISCIDLARFCSAMIGQTRPKKRTK